MASPSLSISPAHCTRPAHRRRRRRTHMKKRRLSIQAIFNRDEPVVTTTKIEQPGPGLAKFKTLPRSFAANAVAYYDAPPLVPNAVSAADDSPFLLDDDPFADLTGGPKHPPPTSPESSHNNNKPDPTPPASPLADTHPSLPHPHPPPPPIRAASHNPVTPAYQKPAFKSRPSLPSLHTLAQMSVASPSPGSGKFKLRRGRVGAGLPFEPWDLDISATSSPASATPDPLSSHAIPIPPRLDATATATSSSSDDIALSTTPTPANPTPQHVHVKSKSASSATEPDVELNFSTSHVLAAAIATSPNTPSKPRTPSTTSPSSSATSPRPTSPIPLLASSSSPPRKAPPTLALDPLNVNVEFSSSFLEFGAVGGAKAPASPTRSSALFAVEDVPVQQPDSEHVIPDDSIAGDEQQQEQEHEMALDMEFARELTAGFGGLNADDSNSSSNSSVGEVSVAAVEQEVDREPALGRNTSRRLSVQQQQQRVVEPQAQEEEKPLPLEGEKEKEQGGQGQLRPALIPRRTTSLSALREAAGVAEASSPRSPMRAAQTLPSPSHRTATLPSPIRPSQTLPSPVGVGAIALPLAFSTSGGRAGRTPSSSRGGSISRTHSRAPSEGGIPEVDEGEEEDEGFVASPVEAAEVEGAYNSNSHSHSGSNSHSHSSSSSYDFDSVVKVDEDDEEEMRLQMQKRQRRRFRKSSLVGDVLRFAPGSPNADAVASGSSSAAVDGVNQSGSSGGGGGGGEGQGLEKVELELSGEDVKVMGGMGVRVDGMGVDIQLGDLGIGAEGGVGLDLDSREAGEEGEWDLRVDDSELAYEDSFELDPATEESSFELDPAALIASHPNRSSAFSMENEVGHEPIDGGVAFPSRFYGVEQGGDGHSQHYPYPYGLAYGGLRSPDDDAYGVDMAQSPPDEGYVAYGNALHMQQASSSPPYSTPSAVSAASSSSETSENAREFDFGFGWAPHERRRRGTTNSSASASASEYEYDGSDSDGGVYYENGHSDVYNGHSTLPDAPVPPPLTPMGLSFGTAFSSTAAYSDDELVAAMDGEMDGDDKASMRGLSEGQVVAFAGDPTRGRAFVFPVRQEEAGGGEGTSAGTIRASAMRVRGGAVAVAVAGVVRDEGYWEGEVGDSSGWEGTGTGGRGYARSGGGGGGGGSGSGSRARSTGRGGGDEGYGGGYGGGGGWAGGGGGGDDGDDRHGRDPRASSFSTPSESESESDSEDDESEDDYGEPSTANNNAAHNAPANNAGDGSDDDIPLAQRIPSALTAQKTIRRKVREERDQRRRERAARRAAGEDTRSRQTTLRPAGAGDASHAVAESSSREAARQAEAAMARAARQRTQTLPGNGPTQSPAVDDLTKKLQSMQQQTRQRTLTINTAAGGSSPVPMLMKSPRLVSASASPPAESAGRGLRPMRSFHRPTTAGGVESSNVPLPQDAGAAPVRRSTTRRRAADESAYLSQGEDVLPKEGMVRRSATTRRPAEESRHHAAEDLPVTSLSAPVRRSATTRRPAEDSRMQDAQRAPRERGLTMPAFLSEPPPSPLPSAAAPSHKLTKARPSGETFPIPPRTSGEAPSQTHKHVSSKSAGTLTRVFIGDMQRFNMIDITPTTSAKHVLTMVDEQGSLKGWVGSGGWMVWEVCQDFGMERPIRSFELLADVQASWNMDKMVNTFIIKLTPLAPTLSRSNIPSSAPVYSGFVDWEMKRGKWTKRYLRLREHSLFLSKRESNKDEVFLCSLSNFDAYTVTRLHKAPKPFVFAVKSTDNLSFFENTADYLHIFACNQSEGEKWMERILLARSYVLYQERNVLFNPKSPAGNAASSAVPGLSRAPTRKIAAPSPRPPGQQPLVTVSPLLNAPDRNDVFAPGSLLHKSPAGTPATQ